MDNHRARTKIQAQLAPSESLPWFGRPRQGFIFRRSDLVIVLISVAWGRMAIVSGYFALESGAPIFILLLDAAIVAISAYLISARFILDNLARRSTYYGITDERVIFLSEFPSRRIRSQETPQPANITLTPDAGLSGSISFGPADPMKKWFGELNLSGLKVCSRNAFYLTEDAKSVLEVLR